jgi:hypothetical protein
VGFAVIKSNDPISSKFIKHLKIGFKINKSVFKKTIPKFNIIICCSEKEFKENSKKDYEKWATATVLKNKNLIIRNQKEYQRISPFKSSMYFNILTHEINHIFWLSLYHKMNPIWLYEGIACYVGNTIPWSKSDVKKMINKYHLDHSILEYRMLNRNFKSGHIPCYPVWAHFCRYLAKRYSISNVIHIMSKYVNNPTKKQFLDLFKKKTGKTYKQVFSEFVKSL